MVAFLSCHIEKNSDMSRNSFSLENSLDLKAVHICQNIIIKSPIKLVLANNNLLIAQFRHDSLISVINLDDENNNYMTAPKGIGPHDFYDLQNLIVMPKDSIIAIHDRNYRKYSYYKINNDSVLLSDKTFIKNDFLKEKEMNTFPIPFDGDYVRYSINGRRMFTLNDKDLNILEAFGDYPGDYPGNIIINKDHFPDFPLSESDLFKLGHINRIISNPQQNILVAAGVWNDWLIFYKKNLNKMVLIKEYYTHDTFTIVTEDPLGTGGKTIGPKFTEQTIASYQDLYATEQHLYALYYGFPELDKGNPDNTCYILQFDWDGNYQKAYHLQEVISHFAVDEERDCIYATYTAKGEDPVLLRYDMY